MRYYSERDFPLGPPRDQDYGVGPNGEPTLELRDDRPWLSVERAAEMSLYVPENWRELA